jgi:uncharacterized membrane protein
MKAFLQGRWFGHPLHPMIVHVPVALWTAALVFDLLTFNGIGGNALVQTAFYAIVIGLIVAVLAILTGLAEYWDILPDQPAHRIGAYHMGLNVVVFALWSVSVALRVDTFREAQTVGVVPLAISILASILLMISGYLGGRMIFDRGIGVQRHAKEDGRERMAQRGVPTQAPEGERA